MKFRNIIVSLKCRNQEKKNWEIPIKIVSLVKMVLRFKESTSKKKLNIEVVIYPFKKILDLKNHIKKK